MIDVYTAYLCAAVLMIAGVIEIAANPTAPRLARYSGYLAAFGFFMLGARYGYLAHQDDLSRLNIFGTASIGAIALGRIIACSSRLRGAW